MRSLDHQPIGFFFFVKGKYNILFELYAKIIKKTKNKRLQRLVKDEIIQHINAHFFLMIVNLWWV